jgi:hypothetical protein
MAITLRTASHDSATTASRPLTHAELDANFTSFLDSSGSSLLGFIQSGIAAVAGTVDEKLKALPINPKEDFGVVGDGSTDDTTAFTAALTAGASFSRPVDISNLTIKLTSTITRTAGNRIIGNGTITHPKDLTALKFDFALGTSTSVSNIGAATNFPALSGNLCTPLTVSSASGFSRGDVCLLHSTDTYGIDSATTKAELLRILEISGTTVYVHGIVQDTYTTSVTLNKLSTEVLEIDGPTFACSEDPYSATGTMHLGAVQVYGAVRPKVKATFRDDTSAGLILFSCWAPQVDIKARNLRDKTADNALGYAAGTYGATAYGRWVIDAERVRHAWTNGLWGASADSDKRQGGAARFNKIYGQAVNTTGNAWDTHPGAFDTMFIGCTADWVGQDGDAASGGQLFGFQDRGCNTRFVNCHELGMGYGWYCAGNLTTHGVTNITELHGCTGRNASGAADAPGIKQDAKTSTDSTITRVYNSVFTDNNFASFGQAMGQIEFYDTVFQSVTNIRLGRDNTVKMFGCRRINTGESTVEPIIVDEGTTLTIDDYYAEATSFGNSSLVRAASTAGTATVLAGSLSCNVVTVAPFSSSTTTLVTQNLPIRPRGPATVASNFGDTNFTLAVGTRLNYIRADSALTQERTLTVQTTAATSGDWFLITRTGGGAFDLIVNIPIPVRLGPNWSCLIVFDGSGWICRGLYYSAAESRVQTVTADRNVVSGDRGTVFTNEGATSQMDFALPSAAAGLGPFTFVVQDADGIQIDAATGDTIRIGADVSSSAGTLTSTTIGDSVTLVAINATEWIAIASVGAGWATA